MKDNPLLQLEKLGQSIWLDYIRRDLMTAKTPKGDTPLRRLIEDDGLRGMTSNPAIFEKAILSGNDYKDDIRSMAAEGMDAETIYEDLTLRDVQMAADEFRPVYEKLDGRDGYVSLEVNPHLAHDTDRTVAEARRLWGALDRPNVFIKVPSTAEGLPAVKQLISEGINVNVTLLFGLPRYRQVAESYIAGIEARLAQGKDVKRVASVASFFLSRIDTLIDPMLRKIITGPGADTELARQSLGQAAVASAKSAYMIYKELFASPRFGKLAAKGARSQRVLWASTGTKDPDYSDVKYVEALIGPDTVNTVPVETLKAYRDHGEPGVRIDLDAAKAARILEHLPELGIGINVVTQQLEDEGVEKFIKAYDALIANITEKL
jgi:transaldolase